jgi:hypothetical protein
VVLVRGPAGEGEFRRLPLRGGSVFIPLATGYSPTLTVVVALFGLYRRRIPEAARAAAARLLEPPVNVLKAAHSGVVGDYVMWLTVGTAVLGGVWL